MAGERDPVCDITEMRTDIAELTAAQAMQLGTEALLGVVNGIGESGGDGTQPRSRHDALMELNIHDIMRARLRPGNTS